VIDVTQLYCPASGGQPGEDNTTHHLVPKSGSMTCTYCGRTEKQLRADAEKGD
jgi:hypothetical protein